MYSKYSSYLICIHQNQNHYMHASKLNEEPFRYYNLKLGDMYWKYSSYLICIHQNQNDYMHASKFNEEPFGYSNLKLGISLRYLKILLTTSKCDVLRHN